MSSKLKFPNETEKYRIEIEDLLKEEIELRRHIETVALHRRQLLQGGKLKEDYEFDTLVDDKVTKIKFSDFFQSNKKSLVIYNMMFGPNDNNGCPACTSILDSLNGEFDHINDKINFIVVAKSLIKKLSKYAKDRSWNKLNLYSSFHNTYNKDYFGELSDDDQMPMLNVFEKNGEEIYHTYGIEMLYEDPEEGQESRHVDMILPLWNMFDYTPEGRGSDWFPKLKYN